MDATARNAYLEAQVMTATPQKLRLMLIEGAVRFARQTLRQWDEGQHEEAIESLIRCRGVISELLSSIETGQTELTRQVTGVYVFLFQSLTQAQLRRDRAVVQSVIDVLEVERETWRLVCEKMPHTPIPAGSTAARVPEILAGQAGSGMGGPAFAGGASASGFVLDA